MNDDVEIRKVIDDDGNTIDFNYNEKIKSILINYGYRMLKEGTSYTNFKINALSVTPRRTADQNINILNIIYYFDILTDDESDKERFMICNLDIEKMNMCLFGLFKVENGHIIMLKSDK